MAHVKNMTHGRPWKLILTFALPLMAGNVFQQLYTLVDTAVVGRFVGVEALASLGAADWLNWLVLGIPTGFAQGFSILMSQKFGAADHDGLKKSVAMSIELSALVAVLTLATQPKSSCCPRSTCSIRRTTYCLVRCCTCAYIFQAYPYRWRITSCPVCFVRWATAVLRCAR